METLAQKNEYYLNRLNNYFRSPDSSSKTKKVDIPPLLEKIDQDKIDYNFQIEGKNLTVTLSRFSSNHKMTADIFSLESGEKENWLGIIEDSKFRTEKCEIYRYDCETIIISCKEKRDCVRSEEGDLLKKQVIQIDSIRIPIYFYDIYASEDYKRKRYVSEFKDLLEKFLFENKKTK